MTKNDLKGPYVFKSSVSILSSQFITLSPAFMFEESGYYKSIYRKQSYWIWFMILAFKLMLSPHPAPAVPKRLWFK